jgi:hypothetical protein
MSDGAKDEILHFIDEMYGGMIHSQAQVVLWSSVKGASVLWCSDSRKAADAAIANAKRIDAYFQPCLHSPELMQEEVMRRNRADGKARKPEPRRRRGYHESVTVMPAVWVDIDTLEGEHKAAQHAGNKLPETTDAVMEMLMELPLLPSFVVRTGGGCHAYWLFDEPLELRTQEERDAARDLSYAWQVGVVSGAMVARGWNAMDSTYDLTRVMRVPGTVNRKYDPPRRVKIVHDAPDNRYTPEEILEYAPEGYLKAPPRNSSVTMAPLAPVEPDAKPDQLIVGMLDMHSDFRFCWDGTTNYKSQSERDMAIAAYMVHSAFEFTDDQIYEALVINRRIHGGQDKANHPTYYGNTIARARRSKTDGSFKVHTSKTRSERKQLAEELQEQRLAELEEKFDEAAPQLIDDNQQASNARAKIISSISEHIGIPADQAIIGIEEISPGHGKRAMYTLVGTPGRVDLGDMLAFSKRIVFDSAIRELFRVPMSTMNEKEWTLIHGMLLRIIDRIDLGDDGTMTGETEGALRSIIVNRCGDMIVSSRDVAIRNQVPWVEGGRVNIVANMMLDDICKLTRHRWDLREFSKRLRNIGASTRRVKVGGREMGRDARTSLSVWSLPNDPEYWL